LTIRVVINLWGDQKCVIESQISLKKHSTATLRRVRVPRTLRNILGLLCGAIINYYVNKYYTGLNIKYDMCI